jgi:hypothetical protein
MILHFSFTSAIPTQNETSKEKEKGKQKNKALHWKVGIKKLTHQRESLLGRE